MRLVGVGVFFLAGCGLLLDVDPPDIDGGPRADGGIPDAGERDVFGQPDVIFDAGFDVPPFDGGGCEGDEDCVDPVCELECSPEGMCVYANDEDDDGICDEQDCVEGEVVYNDIGGMCAERTAVQCRNSRPFEFLFEEVEACNAVDDDCDTDVDEQTGFRCGIGTCAGPRGCSESCAQPAMAVQDPCTPPGMEPVDDDCDGNVDEDCDVERACTEVSRMNPRIDAPGRYCFVHRDCETPGEAFVIEGDSPFIDVELIGSTYRGPGDAIVRCPDRLVPLTTVSLSVPLTVIAGGRVHAENIQFVLGDDAIGPAIDVEDGTFNGYGLVVAGGGSTAVSVGASSMARFSRSSIRSGHVGGHTIDSQGKLILDASCSDRTDGACRLSTGNQDPGLGVYKTGAGGSAVYIHGPAASLEMNQSAVVGNGSAAIQVAGAAGVSIYDSAIFSQSPQPVSPTGRSADAVSLFDCSALSTFRNTTIRNDQGASAAAFPLNTGVSTSMCAVRFVGAPGRGPAGNDIIGSIGDTQEAVGVFCGGTCFFHRVAVTGFGGGASPPPTARGTGVVCEQGCTITDSLLVGNTSTPIGMAVGARIARGGLVLRSRLLGGLASEALGADIVGQTRLQDSVIVGLADGADVGPESLGVGVRASGMVRVLHSTIAGRQWAGTRSNVGCHAFEAEVGSAIAMFNSLLWAGPCDSTASYVSSDPATLWAMEDVGLNTRDGMLPGMGRFPNVFVLSGVTFADRSYTPGTTLPDGQEEMVTHFDVTRLPRGERTIGAYD